MEKAIVIKGKASEVDKIVRENAIRERMGLVTIEPLPDENGDEKVEPGQSEPEKAKPKKDNKEVKL